MTIDRKSKTTMSNILSEFIGDEPIKLYQEVVKKGISQYKVKNLETTENKKELESFSPFHRLTKDMYLSDDRNLRDFHEEIISSLREKKQVEVPARMMESLLSENNVFKNIGNSMASFITKQAKFSESNVNKAVLFVKKSKDNELLKSYLLLKNEKMNSSVIQVLSKGIKNVENPQTNKWIPKEVMQSTGMIQIGLALNDIATTPLDRNHGQIRKDRAIKIRNLAQSGSSSSTTFLNSCKTLARKWEEKNQEILLDYAERQRVKIEKEKNILDQLNTETKIKNTLSNKRTTRKPH